MAGLFFSRKSKNGVGTPANPEPVSPESQTFYDPIPAESILDEPPDAIPGIPDLYAVLGVDARSSDDIIRYAYRKKAVKLHDARWRPGRAARRLAELNAAYEILGKPDRRADYDRQRARIYYYQQAARQEHLFDDSAALPPGPVHVQRSNRAPAGWLRAAAPRGLLEAIAIIGVVIVAIYAGYTVLGNGKVVDFGGIQDAGAAFGLPVRPRTVPTVSPAPVLAAPTATPRQVIVPADAQPSPTATAPPPTAAAAGPVQSTVRVSNPSPPRRSEINVLMRLTRDDRPVVGAPVYLVAHYRTVNERFPAGNRTVPTNENGEVLITFNVGDATAGFPVNLDAIAMVDGAEHKAQTTFVPR
jgi:DnaJ domain